MSILPIIDFTISLALIFTLFSMLTSWIVEFISQRRNYRGRFLKTCLNQLLRDTNNLNLADKILSNPLVHQSKEKPDRLPDSIDPHTFAKALVDEMGQFAKLPEFLHNHKDGTTAVNTNSEMDATALYESGVEALAPSDTKSMLRTHAVEARSRKVRIEVVLEEWYKTYKSETSDWYKRKIRLPLFLVGFGIALFSHVDSLHLTQELWMNAELRDHVAMIGEETVAEWGETPPTNPEYQEIADRITTLQLPIGWSFFLKTQNCPPPPESSGSFATFFHHLGFVLSWCGHNWWHALIKLIGFVVTGFAVTFGAPFWYDLLRRMVGFKKSVSVQTESSSNSAS